MKKKIYGIIILFCAFLLVLQISIPVNAAASVSVAGAKTISEGQKITLTVVGSLEDIGGMEGTFSFDGSILKYLSSSEKATSINGNVISFISTEESGGKISVSFTFQAIRTGSTAISASCRIANGALNAFNANGGATVTVAPPPVKLDSDAKLSSLVVSPGALAPAFDPSIYDYKMQVEVGTTEIAVSAKAANAKAAVSSVNGATGLVKGPNVVTVVVKAENGTTSTYTINVQVGLYPEQVVIEAQVGDLKLKVKNDLTGIVLPDGAVVAPLEIAGETIQAISYNGGMFTLVQLVDDQGVAAFYIYNPEGPTYTLFQEVKVTAAQYVITPWDKSYKIPKGYKKVMITIGEYQNVEALVLEKPAIKTNKKVKKVEAVVEDQYFLFQAKNMAGELNWYQYDAKGGTVQLCAEPTATSNQLVLDEGSKANEKRPVISPTIIIIILSILCVGLAIPLVALIITQPKNDED